MDYRTHIVGGVGLAYAAMQIVPIEPKQILMFYGYCMLGSILPDIDHPEAFISRFIPIVPILLYSLVGHRTLTHSIIFVAIIFPLIASFNLITGIGLVTGIISHILLDLLTPNGVAVLYPFIKRRIKILM